MRYDDAVRKSLILLTAALLGWGLAAFVIALLAPSFVAALLGLLLLNALGLALAWRARTVPEGDDTEWAEARRPQPAAPVARSPRAVTATRPFHLGDPPPRPARPGVVATSRETYICDN